MQIQLIENNTHTVQNHRHNGNENPTDGRCASSLVNGPSDDISRGIRRQTENTNRATTLPAQGASLTPNPTPTLRPDTFPPTHPIAQQSTGGGNAASLTGININNGGIPVPTSPGVGDSLTPSQGTSPTPVITTQPEPGSSTPQNQPKGEKTTRAAIKIASLNIRGGGSLGTTDKWQHINQLMRDKRIGILAIQETHLSDEQIGSLHKQFPQRVHILNSRDPEHPNAKGVAFILNKQLTSWKEANCQVIIPGRALLLTVPWHGASNLTILAVYAPNLPYENEAFWNDITIEFCENNLPPPDIVLGDFNLVEESIDRLPAHTDNERATSSLADFKSFFHLLDGWRQHNPTDLAYTYLQKATGVQSRIDRMYGTDAILKNSREWTIQNTTLLTDHKLISMQFFDPGAPFIGKGRWTIPMFLLEDRGVLKKITELGIELLDSIERCRYSRMAERNPQTLFKGFKDEVSGFARDYARVAIPKLDKKITAEEKQLRTALNEEGVSTEEKQMTAAHIEEKIKELELKRHTKF